MAEAIGIALGVGGLAGLFGAVVDAFDQIKTAKTFSRDYEILLTRYDIRRARLLQWGDGVGVLYDGPYEKDSRLHQCELEPLIGRALGCIYTLLSETDRLKSKYGLQPVAMEASTELPQSCTMTVSQNRLQVFQGSYHRLKTRIRDRQKQASFAKKSQWAISDSKDFRLLLQDLDDLIEDLYRIVPITPAFQRLMVEKDVASLPEDLASLKMLEEACTADGASGRYNMSAWLEAASQRVQTTEMATEDRRDVQEWLADVTSSAVDVQDIDNNTDFPVNGGEFRILHGINLLDMSNPQEGLEPPLPAAPEDGGKSAHPPTSECGNEPPPFAACEHHTEFERGSWAVEKGREAVARLLLATGQLKPDLWGAADNGHEAVVRLLLSTGQVEPDLKDDMYSQTPLSRAVKKGHEAVVRLLLATGQVDPDSKDQYSLTPLGWAAWGGHEAIVRLLLATGQVKLNSKDRYSQTPLSRAAKNGHEAVVRLLLGTGQVDTAFKDRNNRTPLWRAAENGHKAVVQLLLATGHVEPDSKDRDGQTPLSRAVEKGHEVVVRLLLATSQVEPNFQDDKVRSDVAVEGREEG